ncbi:MAG: hypothetical protein AB7T63_10225 [Planctomycetota bacterium]
MLVLRLTSGSESRQVRLARDEVTFGSSPVADVTLQGVGWADEVARARVVDGHLLVVAAGGARGRVPAGGRFTLGPVQVEVLSLGATDPTTGIVFGSYDDDPVTTEARPATFALEPDPGPPVREPVAPAGWPTWPPTGRAARPAASAPPTAAAATTAARDVARDVARAQVDRPPPEPPVEPPRDPTAERPGARSHSLVAPTFAESLVTSLRRAPFFVLSAALHGLAFLLVLMLVDTTEDDAHKSGLGTLEAGLAMDDDLGELPEEVDVEDLVEDLPEWNDTFAQLPEPVMETPPTESAPESDPLAQLAREIESSEVNPSAIGVNPTSDLFRRRAPKRNVQRTPPTPTIQDNEMLQPFAGGHAASANRRAADIVRDMVGRGRRGSGATLDDIRGDDLLVVTGSFDKVGRVLESLRLPFRKTNPYDIRELTDADFAKFKVVFWNCGDPLPQEDMAAVAKRLETFVRQGGYLFTTDWAIQHVVMLAFPGYLATSGRHVALPETIVDIEPARGSADHPLLDGVFLPGIRGRWWLEELAFDVRIGPRGRGHVEPLISSAMLHDTMGVSPYVAVVFKYGRGRVLHAMGHYFQEAGNVAGAVASQRLALNFVLERVGRRER